MDLAIGLGLGLAAGALGLASAQIAGPQAWGWPSRDGPSLVRRIKGLSRGVPGRRRRLAGQAGLAALLSAGALAAYAAAPAAPPPRPPALSPVAAVPAGELHLVIYRGAAGEQMAEQYREALGEPTSSPAAPTRRSGVAPDLPHLLPAQYVAVAQAEIAAGRWDGKAHWGLSLAETAKLVAYGAYRDQVYASWDFANWQPGRLGISGAPSPAQAVGPAYLEYLRLEQRRVDYELAHQAQELAANPIRGPSLITVAAGQLPVQAAKEQGVDPRGLWIIGRSDAEGARRLRRVADAPYMIFAPLELQARQLPRLAGASPPAG